MTALRFSSTFIIFALSFSSGNIVSPTMHAILLAFVIFCYTSRECTAFVLITNLGASAFEFVFAQMHTHEICRHRPLLKKLCFRMTAIVVQKCMTKLVDWPKNNFRKLLSSIHETLLGLGYTIPDCFSCRINFHAGL